MANNIFALLGLALSWIINPLFFVNPLIGEVNFEVFVVTVTGALLPLLSKAINTGLRLTGRAKFLANLALSILLGVGITLYYYGWDFINSASAVLVIFGVSTTIYNLLMKKKE